MPNGIVKSVTKIVTYRKKFDAKLAPTQCYQEEKELVVQAVNDHNFESISAFVRIAVREKLQRFGYQVPADSEFDLDPEKIPF